MGRQKTRRLRSSAAASSVVTMGSPARRRGGLETKPLNAKQLRSDRGNGISIVANRFGRHDEGRCRLGLQRGKESAARRRTEKNSPLFENRFPQGGRGQLISVYSQAGFFLYVFSWDTLALRAWWVTKQGQKFRATDIRKSQSCR